VKFTVFRKVSCTMAGNGSTCSVADEIDGTMVTADCQSCLQQDAETVVNGKSPALPAGERQFFQEIGKT